MWMVKEQTICPIISSDMAGEVEKEP